MAQKRNKTPNPTRISFRLDRETAAEVANTGAAEVGKSHGQYARDLLAESLFWHEEQRQEIKSIRHELAGLQTLKDLVLALHARPGDERLRPAGQRRPATSRASRTMGPQDIVAQSKATICKRRGSLVMLSIKLITPGGEEYYIELAAEDYYLSGGEPPGRWIGQGAKALALCGIVDKEVFRSVFRGHHPATGMALVRNAGYSDRQAAWDLTFSHPRA